MKKTILSLLSLLLLVVTAQAQTVSKGYYRVQSFSSNRYIYLVDYKTRGVDVSTTGYDVDALRTWGPFSRVVSDPSTVYFIENAGGYFYNLKGQGKDVYDFVGRYLTVKPINYQGQTLYTASGIYQGVEVFLADSDPDPDFPDNPGFLNTGGNALQKMWKILPVNVNDNSNYFGITPEVTIGDKYYAPFFASFPFTPYSSGLKAYTVTTIDGDMAVMTEVQGKVAGGTPVIIACPSSTPAGNRINIEMQDAATPAGNLLKGEYFNSSDFYGSKAFHYNALPWDAATMRILGVTSDGKLGFIKSTKQKTIPRNKAYIVVSANAPDEIKLMTQAEYDEEKAKDAVTVVARSYSRQYGDANPTFEYDVTNGILNGVPALSCAATPSSPVGTYSIVVERGTVTNNQFTGTSGTLTVTKAPLTVTARSYTIKQNEPLPAFEADYAGFKLGETASVLTAQPQFSCSVPSATYYPVGTYDITVTGAAAGNYDISYVAGKLTVVEADPITVTVADATMVYGDAVPTFTYTVSGGQLDGTPVITCEATSQTPVGTYPIVVARGTVNYPNLVLNNAELTITQAPLTVKARSYVMKQSETVPVFEADFTGFKNEETADVLTSQPVLACADIDQYAGSFIPVGTYVITVSGAEAQNYDISYVNGTLTVTEDDAITLIVNDATMVYGDAVPEFTYTVSGGEVEGTPVITCEATSQSSVGTYDIVIARGTVTWPNLVLVNGTLTITPATITASVGDYVREQGEDNPEFVITYDGFRNNDDASVFTTAPVASCTADATSEPGFYDIIVSGGEALNYVFTYVNGRLEVKVPDAITAATLILRTPSDIYTVDGRCVRRAATSMEGLRRGIYIVNGRKVVVK